MRITNNLLVGRYMNNYTRTLDRLQTTQIQMSSGRRINKLSDDPVSLVTVLASRSKLQELDQFGKNVSYATSYVNSTESSVTEMNAVIVQMYDKLLQSVNAPLSQDDRTAIRAEAAQLRDHVLDTILNSTFGEKNMFGGYNVNETPFKMGQPTLVGGNYVWGPPANDGTDVLFFNGVAMYGATYSATDFTAPIPPATVALLDQNIDIEITRDVWVNLTINGAKLAGLGNDNVIKVFNDIINAFDGVSAGTMTEDAMLATLQGSITKLQNKQTDILSMITELGGKAGRLDYLADRFDKDIIAYHDIKSRLEDIDEAQAIMNFKMAQAAFDAALGSGPYVLQRNLMDFLR